FLASHPAADGDTLTLTKQVPLSTVKHIYSFTPASTSVYSLAAVVGSTSWNGSSIYYNLRDNAIFNLSVLARDASITNATLNLFAKPEQIELYNSNPDSAHRNSTSSELYGYFERLLGPVTVDSTTWANQPAVTEVNRVTIGPFPIGYSNSDYTDQECTNLVKDLFSAYLNGTNYGMRLRLSDEDTESKDLKSIIFWNNSTTIDYDVEPPYINVTYTASRCEEFTAYVNEQMGWSYTKAQLNSIIQRACSSTTDICEYVSYTSYDGDLLCGKSTAIFGTVNDSITNCSDTAFFAYTLAYEKYHSYRDSLRNSFDKLYRDTAFAGGERELFTMSYATSEYHYTLYYYDQAGNLVRTVPPSGVVINRAASWRAALAAARASGSTYVPAHTQATEYRYNTLNQVISQRTPDGGVSNFWYDRLGRLVISQNAKQIGVNAYSYTSYDGLGRISEVGEITSSTAMTNDVSRSEAGLSAWMSAARGTRTQIVQTIYDTLYTPISGTYLTQENLRNRVSWSSYFNTSGAQDSMNFATATFYSYDIHGNVGTLLQDYKGGTMSRLYNRFKKIQYKYDLISGKVNWVGYQPGEKDAFYHRYSYDAENRLTNVETSHDSIYWENEAYYEYYKHGPLSRTVLGQQQVQGVDYAYTLQGWLKGVNSTAVTPVFDMGGDGSSGSQVAKDVYGFGIHYYGKRDYTPINSAVTPFATGIGIKVLFNGNIAAISQNIPLLGKPLEYTYSYDVLNRLKGMVACKGFDSLTNAWNNSFATLSDFKETISYDGNGNIQTYVRHGNNTFAGSPLAMDSLVYNYRPGTNKLSYVTDAVDSSYYGNDIDNQDAGNYAYDSIGNVLSDVRAGVDSIKWTMYGKIARIYKHNGKVISYSYDAGGNRISKTVDSLQTWYVRDAGGNVLSVYNYGDTAINSGDLSQTEAHLYGSSRLGMATMTVNVEDTTAGATTNITGLGTGKNIIFRRGKKFFELTNHLGNVLATVSDRKIQVSGNGTTVDYYNADVVSAQDYYPFGMIQPGRSYNAGGYRYGFNGKENDNEVKGEGNQIAFEARAYDSRVGKFLSIDPLTKNYPNNSPYIFGANNPVTFIDALGMWPDWPGWLSLPDHAPTNTWEYMQAAFCDACQFVQEGRLTGWTEAGRYRQGVAYNATMSTLAGSVNGNLSNYSFGLLNRSAESIGINDDYAGYYDNATLITTLLHGVSGGTGTSPRTAFASSGEAVVANAASLKINPSTVVLAEKIKNKVDGDAREDAEFESLKKQNPDAKVWRERYLRDANGKIVKDPITGTGRRIDFSVVMNDKVSNLVEVTSLTANKGPQALKEERIREAGGTYIKAPGYKGILYPVQDIVTQFSRRK
ncbi:RHS repeat-associated core domain-containing protein, partial [[Flexibacter] sp. ATCC 35208]|uniref:RHS repeat-associated core domain-containing protein n=1 Tax=[Flexibacter] sp. ATCC 35208 TaxID=1936242 RepID=UPI0009D24F99